MAESAKGGAPSKSRRNRIAARRRKMRRRALVALGAAVVLVVAVVGGAWLWYRSQLGAAGGVKKPIVVTIPKGANTAGIGKTLAKDHVIQNATAFELRVRFSGSGPFEAGRYRLVTNSSVASAITALSAGPLPPLVVRITFPEGFRLDQILTRIHDQVPRFSLAELRSALSSRSVHATLLPTGSKNYEGLLFPATYDVMAGTTPTKLLQTMADAMNDRVMSNGLDAEAAKLHLTPYQVLTVASLIQAEAGNPDEAPKIARVIYNRLAANQALGIDATSRYLSIISGEAVDFESASPFNTRRRPGLPPTPIDSPGDMALNAAINPAEGNWIYYVRDVHNDAQGRPQHVFTDSVQVFEQAKRACHAAGLGCGA